MGTTAAAPSSSCAQPPRPLNTGRRERAEGNGEKPKTLTGCLRGGAKAEIGALEMPARYGPPAALRCALGCGLSALGLRVAAEGLVWGSAPRFLNFPAFGGLFDPPFSVFDDLKLKLRVWRPQERGAPGLRGVRGGGARVALQVCNAQFFILFSKSLLKRGPFGKTKATRRLDLRGGVGRPAGVSM